jgi:hypothetical protein
MTSFSCSGMSAPDWPSSAMRFRTSKRATLPLVFSSKEPPFILQAWRGFHPHTLHTTCINAYRQPPFRGLISLLIAFKLRRYPHRRMSLGGPAHLGAGQGLIARPQGVYRRNCVWGLALGAFAT